MQRLLLPLPLFVRPPSSIAWKWSLLPNSLPAPFSLSFLQDAAPIFCALAPPPPPFDSIRRWLNRFQYGPAPPLPPHFSAAAAAAAAAAKCLLPPFEWEGSETWDDDARIPILGRLTKDSPLFSLSLFPSRICECECKLGPGNGIFRRDGLSFSIFHDLKQVARCGTLLVSIAGYFSPSGQRGNKSTINGRLSATLLFFCADCFCVSWTSAVGRKKTDVEWRFTHSGAKYIEQ